MTRRDDRTEGKMDGGDTEYEGEGNMRGKGGQGAKTKGENNKKIPFHQGFMQPALLGRGWNNRNEYSRATLGCRIVKNIPRSGSCQIHPRIAARVKFPKLVKTMTV